MPSRFIDPLDIRKIFVEYFLGTQELLIFALLILISFACAKFNMSNKLFFIVLIISSVLMGVYLGEVFYILILILIGFFVFKRIGRFFS